MMKQMTNWALVQSIIVMLSLCGCTKPPAPVEAHVTHKPYPAWYTAPQNSDEQYMYATGNGEDKDEAVNNALNNMVAELGVTIESTFESYMEVKSSFATKELKSNIKADVAKIRISNYQVIAFEKMRFNESIVLIRSDRLSFSSSLKKSIDVNIDAIDKEKQTLSSENMLVQYNSYVDLNERAKALVPSIVVLSSVDKNFDGSKYFSRISALEEGLHWVKKNLRFFVTGDKSSKPFETKMKNFISGKGLRLNSESQKGDITIQINTDVKIEKVTDSMQLSVFMIDVKAFADNKRIGGKSLIVKERYSGSMDASYKNAAIHLEQDMKENDIETIIGIKIK